MEHVLAPRGGPYRNRKPREEKNKKQSLISRQRGRNGRVRDFAYTERARRNTKRIKDRHRQRLCYIAREKVERKRSLKNEIYHPSQYRDTKKAEGKRRDGVLVRLRHRTTGAAVCVSRAHLYGLR